MYILNENHKSISKKKTTMLMLFAVLVPVHVEVTVKRWLKYNNFSFVIVIRATFTHNKSVHNTVLRYLIIERVVFFGFVNMTKKRRENAQTTIFQTFIHLLAQLYFVLTFINMTNLKSFSLHAKPNLDFGFGFNSFAYMVYLATFFALYTLSIYPGVFCCTHYRNNVQPNACTWIFVKFVLC